MGDMKKRTRRFLRVIPCILVIVVITIFLLFKYAHGTISIPKWLRIKNKEMYHVENYHSNLKFAEVSGSLLPRIDIVMEEDYQLSRETYTKCTVQIKNAKEYDLDVSSANIRIRGNSTSHCSLYLVS